MKPGEGLVILAGYAWDQTNLDARKPKRRLAALEELCYQK
jgi:hypothetical protein